MQAGRPEILISRCGVSTRLPDHTFVFTSYYVSWFLIFMRVKAPTHTRDAPAADVRNSSYFTLPILFAASLGHNVILVFAQDEIICASC